MKISLEKAAPESLKTGALIQLQFEGEKGAGIADDLLDSGEITGKSLEFTILHNGDGTPARRLVIAGAGKRAEFDAAVLRKTVSAAVRFVKSKSIRDAVLSLSTLGTSENVAAAAEGAILGNFRTGQAQERQDGFKGSGIRLRWQWMRMVWKRQRNRA